jgi:lipopolysaccharide/colanic/teichoic acid biosynthesis glycosyltransferase
MGVTTSPKSYRWDELERELDSRWANGWTQIADVELAARGADRAYAPELSLRDSLDLFARRQGVYQELVAEGLEELREMVVQKRPRRHGSRSLRTYHSRAALGATQFFLKRLFDVLVATFLLILLAPLFLSIVIGIKLTSPGPVFYRSIRLGIGNLAFASLAFRTMRVDAGQVLDELRPPVFDVAVDPRITRLGRFLRRTALNELPQLLNVLRGEMSLVGPRPLPIREYGAEVDLLASDLNRSEEWLQLLEEWYWKRSLVLPGLTGLWAISDRASNSFQDSVKLDLNYIDRWSPLRDLVILFKAFTAALRRQLTSG